MKKVIEQITEDGSHTLYVPDIDESYHSTFGAMQESQFIFIKDGFLQIEKSEIDILEVGFGTGLNAFLTILESEKCAKKVRYTAVERFPLPISILKNLNYSQKIDISKQNLFLKLHSSEWGKFEQISENFQIEKIETDVNILQLEKERYDLIYFDAFSPEKQPEMWSEELFGKIFASCRDNAVFVTYCVKGVVKRALRSAGFEIEKIPGPKGKREILRAYKRKN